MLEKDDLIPELYSHYERSCRQLLRVGYPGDRPFLDCEDVLDAHYLICNHFLKAGKGIAGFGPRDFGLLNSAVGRQLSSAGGEFIYRDIWDISASLIFGLINDHPFHDGNKRTAFLSAVFFMMEHNFTPDVSIVEIENFTVEIADHKNQFGHDIDISRISSQFKRMFRRQDNRISYIITFNELSRLLRKHDCSIRNPSNNYIDVYKEDTRVSQIGFPGWSREVSRNAISTVRKTTGLTSDNGIDAQVFFKGKDPLSELIGQYEEPLMRLANR